MNLAPRFTQDAPTYGGGVGEGSHVRVHKPLHYSGVSGLARPSHGSQHPQLSRASPEEGKKGKATNRGVWGASSHQGRAAHILTNLKTQTTSAVRKETHEVSARRCFYILKALARVRAGRRCGKGRGGGSSPSPAPVLSTQPE